MNIHFEIKEIISLLAATRLPWAIFLLRIIDFPTFQPGESTTSSRNTQLEVVISS
jgi:hypothetical protein